MATYYDDNYGAWDDCHEPEVRAFYRQVQEDSEEKECCGCGHIVRILPHYAYCNSCADARERGYDI